MTSFLDDPIVLNAEDSDCVLDTEAEAEAMHAGLSMDDDEEAHVGQDKNYQCFSSQLAASPLDKLDKAVAVAVDESTESEAEYEGKGNWLFTTFRNCLTANPLADPAASVSFAPKLTPPHSPECIVPADYVFNLSKEQQEQYGPLSSVLEAGRHPAVRNITQHAIDNQHLMATRSSTGLLPKNMKVNRERLLNEMARKPTGVRRKRTIPAELRTRAARPAQQQLRYGALRLLEKNIKRSRTDRWKHDATQTSTGGLFQKPQSKVNSVHLRPVSQGLSFVWATIRGDVALPQSDMSTIVKQVLNNEGELEDLLFQPLNDSGGTRWLLTCFCRSPTKPDKMLMAPKQASLGSSLRKRVQALLDGQDDDEAIEMGHN
jgi:hypothetical protein